MRRRDLLKAAPALALVGAAPAVAAQADTPVIALFRKWDALFQAGYRKMADADHQALIGQQVAIEQQVKDLPCATAADFAAKIAMLTQWGAWHLPEEGTPEGDAIWAEARVLIGGGA